MLKRSENILHRLFVRETCRAPSNSHVHRVRQLYENIVPNHTVYDIECPDHFFRKFTNDGQYLICFSRNYQDLIVYRFSGLNYCTKGLNCDASDELPVKARKFESYFLQLYSICLGSATELICKDFFLSTENNSFGVFATTTGSDSDAPTTREAVQGVPSIERTTIYLVRLADGMVVDQRSYHDDFIHLAHNAGVFMYDDLLAILSIRYQSIHILQVRDVGMFVDVRTIGTFCREDDELIINSQAQEEILFQRRENARKGKSLNLEGGLSLPLKLHEMRSDLMLSRRTKENVQEDGIRGDLRGHDRDISSPGTVAHSGVHNSNQGNLHGGSPVADIDIQYDNYFKGLFGSVNVSCGARTEGCEEMFSAETSEQPKAGRDQPRPQGSEHVNQGVETLSSFNQASVMPLVDGRHTLGQMVTTWNASSPDYSFDTNGYERIPSSDTGERGNAEIILRVGVSASPVNTNIVSSSTHGTESESSARNPSVSAGTASYSVYSAGTHLEGNPVQFIISSRSLGSQHPQVASEERMHIGSHPVSPSLNGNNAYGNIPALQTQIGDTSATERLHSSTDMVESNRSEAGLESVDRSTPFSSLSSAGNQFLGGIKQRLLSFLFQSIWNQDLHRDKKAQQLKRFYYHFGDYVDLVMWKVQFLDRHHLLIKFGSVDNVVSRNSDASHQTAFLAVYNMETTEIVEFQQNSPELFLQTFEHFCDHFRVVPRFPASMSYITSHSNNIFSREQLRKQKTTPGNSKAGSYAHVVKRTLALLPFSSQSQSPSVYFDQSLFHFDEKLISATERHKPCMENPIKFLSRRRPNSLKFKINPGLELGYNDGRVKRVASFLFHPILPFIISIQQSFMQPSIVNLHYRK